ncbi:PIN-like domain-containing protein [Streptomyces sp. NPDC102259]|uniref:PIN-like domain-containing protein n=1 Tax=Streptomyces sp. NPDC102259 TaxID=3366148 RepID=UPI0037FC5D99
MWEQIIREAVRRQCDVLFVTADAKEDWWRKEQGFSRGPRPELTAELKARGGGQLFMLTPKGFLEVAAPILKFSLQEGSVEDIARVERIEAEETDDAPVSFEDLLDRIADLPLLHFTGSREVTAGLDAVAYGSSWVRMAWDAVRALRDFAEAVTAGRTG